jgi:hypothetical protein
MGGEEGGEREGEIIQLVLWLSQVRHTVTRRSYVDVTHCYSISLLISIFNLGLVPHSIF